MNKLFKFIKKNKYWILGLLIVILAIVIFIVFKGKINMLENSAAGIPMSSGGGSASSGGIAN